MKKLREKKSFVNNGTSFLKFEIMQWNGVINKEGFLNQDLFKVSKLLVFVLSSFFIISNIMVKTFFQE